MDESEDESLRPTYLENLLSDEGEARAKQGPLEYLQDPHVEETLRYVNRPLPVWIMEWGADPRRLTDDELQAVKELKNSYSRECRLLARRAATATSEEKKHSIQRSRTRMMQDLARLEKLCEHELAYREVAIEKERERIELAQQ
eukprot:scaffold1738_cov325-Pavlova_lutheri.AAC.1